MKKTLTLLIDINDTFTRTGEVSKKAFLNESRMLYQFVSECKALSKTYSLFHLVFVTGNSFEYARRIEEPLGLKNITGVSITIISENGLVARSFNIGELWKLKPSSEYYSCVEYIKNQLRDRVCYFCQGNEIRLTIKPCNNIFSQDELSFMRKIANKPNIKKACKTYVSKYYVDFDPLQIIENGKKTSFKSKKYAVLRLLKNTSSHIYAVGDSLSDIPMFKAVDDLGGKCYWVGNTPRNISVKFAKAPTLQGEFIESVLYLTRQIVKVKRTF